MLRLLVLPALLLAVLTPSITVAQTYVTMTAHRVPFERVDTLRKLLKETQRVSAEAKRLGGILDNVWLVHSWGGEYNVVQMITWKSWAAIEDTTLSLDAATRKVYPDSVARKKMMTGSIGSSREYRTSTTSIRRSSSCAERLCKVPPGIYPAV